MRRRLGCWRAHREDGEVGYSETGKMRIDPISLTARERRSVDTTDGQMQRGYQCPLRGAGEDREWGSGIEGAARRPPTSVQRRPTATAPSCQAEQHQMKETGSRQVELTVDIVPDDVCAGGGGGEVSS